MKKALWVLGTVAIMSLSACGSDDEENASPNIGQYAPGMKITEIRSEGTLEQSWIWNGNRLDTVNYHSDQSPTSAFFTYENNRLVQVTGPYSTSARLSYSGTQLTQIEFHQDGISGTFSLEYSNDKVSRMTLPFSRETMEELAGDEFPEFITRGTGAMNIDFAWAGNNVARQDIAATFTTSISGSELMDMAAMMGLDEMLEPIAPFANLLANFQFPLIFSMTSSVSASYDNKHNPFQSYFGSFDIENLHILFSANNPTHVASSSTMNYSLSLPDGLPAMLAALGVNLADYGIEFPVEGSIPMDEDDDNYSYQYNDKGFPSHVDDGYRTREIIYAQ